MGEQEDKDERLLSAARLGEARKALRALKDGARPEARTGQGFWVLCCAVAGLEGDGPREWRDREAIAKALMRAGAAPIAGNGIIFGALHQAAFTGAPSSLIEALVEAGAPLEARVVGGQTALSLAAEAGRARAIGALLRLGADPASADGEGLSPQGWAERSGEGSVFLSELAKLEADAIGRVASAGSPSRRPEPRGRGRL